MPRKIYVRHSTPILAITFWPFRYFIEEITNCELASSDVSEDSPRAFNSPSPKKKSEDVEHISGIMLEKRDPVTSWPSTFRTTPPDDKLDGKRERPAPFVSFPLKRQKKKLCIKHSKSTKCFFVFKIFGRNIMIICKNSWWQIGLDGALSLKSVHNHKNWRKLTKDAQMTSWRLRNRFWNASPSFEMTSSQIPFVYQRRTVLGRETWFARRSSTYVPNQSSGT